MKAGPKAALTAPPLDLRRLPKRGGSRAVGFIERYVTVPKGTGEGRRLKLRPWQRRIVHGLLNEPRPRQGLVSMPAGNAKSTLGAGLGLYGLLGDGVMGAQVPIVASDKRQAGIIQGTARRMVELDEELSAQVQVYHDYLYVPRTDSVLQALPAELAALQGWDPSMGIIDELHVVTTDVYESMAARAGKRDRSLLLALSTPPRDGDTDSVMWRLVEHGRYGADPSFYFTEFAAPAGCAVDDEDAWQIANPALDDFLHRDALRATLPPKMRENAFRRYRLGQWVGVDDAWLPDGAWAACTDASLHHPDGAEVVLAFDGSFNGDTTVLVVATVDQRPHIDLVELWEAAGTQVPIVDVEAAIRQACRRWRVLEIAADPFRWARSLQLLDGEGFPVLEYPQSPGRMTPATARF
jgi:phage terminase large subunit-like protein